MFKFIIVFIILSLSILAGPSISKSQISYDEDYYCELDSCLLIWTGKTLFCQGINCRTVKIYKCGCCRKSWKVYMD